MKIFHHICRRLWREQSGQVLFLTLVLILVIGLILVPMASLLTTGAHASMPYKNKMDEIYAADAGIQDARWQIKYGQLSANYSALDFYSTWNSTLAQQINDKTVNVSLKNFWIPPDVSAPSISQAQVIINGQPALGLPPKVVITSMATSNHTFELKIQNYPYQAEKLIIYKIGCWLPPGYTYVSSNISGPPNDLFPVQTSPYDGGQSVIWNLDYYPFAGDDDFGIDPFPGVQPNAHPQCGTIQVTYQTSQTGAPDVVSWVVTDPSGIDLTYGLFPGTAAHCAWDANVKIFKISSTAGSTSIDAYTSRDEIRPFGSAVTGDYYATGNSLIGGNTHPPDNYHTDLYRATSANVPSSDGSVPGMPADAKIQAAYLYWTGWIDWHNFNPPDFQVFYDNCSSLSANWSAGSKWSVYNNQFRGQGGGNSTTQRTLAMACTIDLSDAESATISWKQSSTGVSSNESLYYATSEDGGTTWDNNIEAFHGTISQQTKTITVPGEVSAFKMRFYYNFTGSTKYVYLDDITIKKTVSLEYPGSPTSGTPKRLIEKTARVNNVLLNNTAVTADAYQVLYPSQFDEKGNETYKGSWYYTAMSDVTDLVQNWAKTGAQGILVNGPALIRWGTITWGPHPARIIITAMPMIRVIMSISISAAAAPAIPWVSARPIPPATCVLRPLMPAGRWLSFIPARKPSAISYTFMISRRPDISFSSAGTIMLTSTVTASPAAKSPASSFPTR